MLHQHLNQVPPADSITPTTPSSSVGEQLRIVFSELREIREILVSKRKPTLTVGEVAALVGRDPYTIRNWIKTGRINAIRVMGTGPRGRLLIDRSEIDRLLADGRGGNVPDTAMS